LLSRDEIGSPLLGEKGVDAPYVSDETTIAFLEARHCRDGRLFAHLACITVRSPHDEACLLRRTATQASFSR
jgi:hypothetical protein